ncbi:tryptophan-rich sensory protein [Staphylococcus sp. 170179]|uniref:Tryptophan-rich sensory protein n=2 Tax=Staphylococcus borealis TaxID=2742203 RepID=A0ABX2LLX7_9STAP|nr:TspO/MBR family protein [Staphylococcus borealis]MEB6609303.1 tryptophan-rich sensory protein [Staphylococcus borealis]MEB7365293.1 tryptophan-rich sensory protein [Staphylococcus borealis]MEB7459487.1 tryptophan-rich sensory protein [Staphylococcus borealis]MUN93139.1 tryptophan-rich sensory protein [Staphylococcus borealis]NUI80203.1 tryptophan-rich sensory protein [Staphylococcus borealis]
MTINILKNTFKLLHPMVGGSIIGRVIAKESKEDYNQFRKPPFSPPTKAFPIVWPILYVLMGVSYLLTTKNNEQTTKIKVTHYSQLALNYLWSILYFKKKVRGIAFIESMMLFISVVVNTISMFKIHRIAGLLQIPYVMWSAFASYLNAGNYFLNKDNPNYKKQ